MPTDKQSAERARAEKFVESKLTRMVRFPDDVAGWLTDFAALAVERERKTCADIAGGMTGPGNTVEQCKGYSDACRDIQRAIRARDAERG